MNIDNYPWSDEQKRQYVWGNIKEAAQTAGTNQGTYVFYTVQDEGDFSPIFLSKSEQRVILQDFASEGKIALLANDDPTRRGEWDFELLEPEHRRKSTHSLSIRSLADLVKNIGLRNRVMGLITKSFGVIDAREIKQTQAIETDMHESDDELLLLMDELGLTETKWESLKNQTHRTIGNRYVRVLFHGDKAKVLADAMSGRSSTIKIKALEQIATTIKDWMTMQELNDFFIQLGVPTSLLLDNQATKKDLVYNVLLALSSSGEETDKLLLFQILEDITHPLIFAGDTERSKKAQFDISKVLRYDGLTLVGGKMRALTDEDRTLLDKYEATQKMVDPDLVQALDGFFGGNPFAGFVAPRKAARKSQPTPPAPSTKEAPTTHIHIHNQNTAVQSLQVPSIHTQERNEPKQPNISLKDVSVQFDDNVAQIKIGIQTCQLPPFKNEHFFCRAVFQYQKDEPIDWSLIYEKMTGKEPVKSEDSDKMSPEQRSVYDTMNAVNKRVMDVAKTKDKLFSWDEKAVTRRF